MNIRLLTFNIHKGVGWTRNPTLDKIHTHLNTLQPDIIFLQEIRGSQFETISSDIWPHLSYGKNAIYHTGHHGNAILSKFPILETDNIDLTIRSYERRGLLHSIIQLNDLSPVFLHLLCVHVGLAIGDQLKQIRKIINYIQSIIKQDEPLILGGDFNDWTGVATKPLIKELNLNEAFLHCHSIYARTFPAWAPLLKLDRIYFRGLHAQHAKRLVDNQWRTLSDHVALETHFILENS